MHSTFKRAFRPPTLNLINMQRLFGSIKITFQKSYTVYNARDVKIGDIPIKFTAFDKKIKNYKWVYIRKTPNIALII